MLKVGRATVTYVVDWEMDGDLDIVSGDIDGTITLVRNGSGDKTLKFDKVEKLTAAGVKIKTPGGNSGPVVTDWDGDGKRDLVVGCGNGSVQFFRNTAEKGEPVFAKGETLIPVSHSFGAQGNKAEPTSPSGYRAKLAVADWNGDGKMDLLVGDAYSAVGKEPELTEEQVAERDAIRTRQLELRKEMQPYNQHWSTLYPTWYARARKELELETETPDREFLGTLEGETRNKFYARVRRYQSEDPKWAEYDALRKEYSDTYTKLRPLQASRKTTGFVWLYARK